MRQKDDLHFAQILNIPREGFHTADDIKMLKSIILSQHETPPKDCLHFFATNKEAAEYNQNICDTLPGPKITFQATDVVGDLPKSLLEEVKDKIPERSQDNGKRLEKDLVPAVGQRVEACINVNVSDGLTNGASGIVTCLSNVSEHTYTCVWILFDDPKVGKITRRSHRPAYHGNISSSWTPISRTSRLFRVGKGHNGQVLTKQFPLRPTSAKTVHRAQGDTVP
ncbi:hypothetical protein HOLleu_00701 [Holothuria leucospilota]|uniref:Uncharacterized protein n=1 Tax=Holothuria leucospilota TaxID=206669 RepID=A0A9Q1HKH9_HOLLE|nr:hypothetical protein HOLleu_00701 [Holothuria leucospilota]